MNLSAIQPRKCAIEAQSAAELAQRNRVATNGNFLFRDTRPVIEAVAKGLQEAIPVKPGGDLGLSTRATRTAASGDLTAVLKAMTDGIAACTAAIRGPVRKAAPAAPPTTAPAAAPPSTLNVMLRSEAKRDRVTKVAEEAVQEGPGCAVPASVEAQRRREAEARELARKNAALADAERVQVQKAGGRVRVLKVLDPSLSDAALMALGHIVAKYQANGQQAVPVTGPDLSRAIDIPLTAAQAGYAELVNKGHVTSAKNSLGITRVTPSRAATGED
ncbi:hypothetical protein SAMN02799636_01574 [Methylobacterium sp. 275MFSha3.1]|uniref:hypothetical protein n=1 Tax=Methylobacterium sp. 275MFSha3.1 TaxID=1502746 RepID=UPI0008A7D864|nr:hypothetical protein [Methylobacterium sp. 275MFSha3.1]SEH34262.1 hypothetical protein SAMN02799636_01574 [Methylobacterium sp. 275MFSha3.1]